MLVIGRQLRRDAVALGQAAGDPGILAGDEVDAGECFQRPHRDVAEIADRRRHQIKPGRRLGRGQPLAVMA